MKVLVPVDGSKYSMEALKVAIDYAKTKGANICLINVAPFIEGIDLEISASERERLNETLTKRADYIVQQACGILTAEDVIATCRHVVAASSVPDAIIDYAEKEKIDLIIIAAEDLANLQDLKWESLLQRW